MGVLLQFDRTCLCLSMSSFALLQTSVACFNSWPSCWSSLRSELLCSEGPAVGLGSWVLHAASWWLGAGISSPTICSLLFNSSFS